MAKVTGFHVMWTLPKTLRNRNIMENYEVALLAISALAYRKATGARCLLYTDQAGLDFYKKRDVLWAWDDVDTHELDAFSSETSKFPFASYENAGKVHILVRHSLPYLYIDNDAILFQNLPDDLQAMDLGYAHREEIMEDPGPRADFKKGTFAYPHPTKYNVPKGYLFHPKYDWENAPIMNTCLLYLNNKELQKEFSEEFYRFLFGNGPGLEPKWRRAQYLFLDQRLLGLIVYHSQFKYASLLPITWDLLRGRFLPDETRGDLSALHKFHHLWMMKTVLAQSNHIQRSYLQNLTQYLRDLGMANEIADIFKRTGYADLNSNINSNEFSSAQI